MDTPENKNKVVLIGAHAVGKTTLMHSLATLFSASLQAGKIKHYKIEGSSYSNRFSLSQDPVLVYKKVDYLNPDRNTSRNMTLKKIVSNFIGNRTSIQPTGVYEVGTWTFRYLYTTSEYRQERSIEAIDVAGLAWSMLLWEVDNDKKWDIEMLKEKWERPKEKDKEERYNSGDIKQVYNQMREYFPDLKESTIDSEKIRNVMMEIISRLENAEIIGIMMDLSRFKNIDNNDYWIYNLSPFSKLLRLLYNSNKKIILILNKLDTWIGNDLNDIQNFENDSMNMVRGWGLDRNNNSTLFYKILFYKMGWEIFSHSEDSDSKGVLDTLENNGVSPPIINHIRSVIGEPLADTIKCINEKNKDCDKYLKNLQIIPITSRSELSNGKIITMYTQGLLYLIENMLQR